MNNSVISGFKSEEELKQFIEEGRIFKTQIEHELPDIEVYYPETLYILNS